MGQNQAILLDFHRIFYDGICHDMSLDMYIETAAQSYYVLGESDTSLFGSLSKAKVNPQFNGYLPL
jgi:hypothetical protein